MNANVSEAFDYFWHGNLSVVYEEKAPCLSETLSELWESGRWEILLYSGIFLLSVVGNTLVILTLAKNSRMRTNTNVFLLNLAVSDLILAVLCMPFTLIGTLLRDFVFGEWMCKLVPFLQATSVAASVWTLVALSIERYYAICHPLRSRRWQTLSHAYHLIGCIWAGSAAFMLPICLLSELQPTNKGHHKCRERWPSGDYERAYNLFLDLLLLVIPLLTLGVTYYLIAVTLWRDLPKKPREGLQTDSIRGKSKAEDHGGVVFVPISNPETPVGGSLTGNLGSLRPDLLPGRRRERTLFSCFGAARLPVLQADLPPVAESPESPADGVAGLSGRLLSLGQPAAGVTGLRHSNYERSLTNKQRVIKMLFVVVLEFFVCWTPLYVINTLALFWPQQVYAGVGYRMISLCQLLAYTSGCCNPITYCFMNKGFRNSFLGLFGCCENK